MEYITVLLYGFHDEFIVRFPERVSTGRAEQADGGLVQ